LTATVERACNRAIERTGGAVAADVDEQGLSRSHVEVGLHDGTEATIG
jgi:hypothetical protein